MEYDVIVIGSGLGGLTAAATLALKKKKVLVLEQHSIPGGCATVFKRKNMRIETGLHEMDWGTPNSDMKRTIFKKLGLDGKLPLIELPHLWTIKTESTELRIPHGYKNVIETLEKEFPQERRGIRTYFRKLVLITYPLRKLPQDLSFLEFYFYLITAFPLLLNNLLPPKSEGKVLDGIIKSDTLKRILNINLGYFHDNPHEFIWQFHAVAMGNYYRSSCYIKGGSQVLSDMLVQRITENGGEVKLQCDVTKVEVEKRTAKRVLWTDKKTKKTYSAAAKIIVANCAPDELYKNLLSPEYEDRSLQKLSMSPSLFNVYVIFKKQFRDLFPNNAYSTFITSDKRLNAKFLALKDESRGTDVEKRDFVFVDYSAIDSGLTEEGDPRSPAFITGISYMDEWEQLDGETYSEKKELLAQTIFARLEKLYPGFTENIEYYEVSTPKTIRRFIRSPEGTAYGYRQNSFTKGRVGRQSKTVKNIFFAGAWAFPGGGFTGAIISGYMAARHILFSTPLYVVLGTILCTLIGTLVGTAPHWIAALLSFLAR